MVKTAVKKKEEPKALTLRKYEQFFDSRLQEYLASYKDEKLDLEVISKLCKSVRIFIEQTVRRIAYRQQWTWAQPNVKVIPKKNNNKKVK
jgi:hypothetical protein